MLFGYYVRRMSDKCYCVKCKKPQSIGDPIRVKIRNRKTRNEIIDALKGKCPECDGAVYVIVGHG